MNLRSFALYGRVRRRGAARFASSRPSGAPPGERYLSFQEYFGKPGANAARWGKARRRASRRAAGAARLRRRGHRRQGLHERHVRYALDVPPTLVSFALADWKRRNRALAGVQARGGKGRRCSRRSAARTACRKQGSLNRLLRAGVRSSSRPAGCGRPTRRVRAALPKRCSRCVLATGWVFGFPGSCSTEELFQCRVSARSFWNLARGRIPWRAAWRDASRNKRCSGAARRIELDALEAAFDGTLEDIFPTQNRASREGTADGSA